MTMRPNVPPENPLVYGKDLRLVPVELAADIGLPEAMIIQQIDYWMRIASKDYPMQEVDGVFWVRIPERNLASQFPFWCLGVIQRALKNLRDWGLIRTATFNDSKWDKGFWYAIDRDRVDHHEDVHPKKRLPPRRRDSMVESSRLDDRIVDDSITGSTLDSVTESTPDSMVESSLIKTNKKIPEDIKESVPGSAGTPPVNNSETNNKPTRSPFRPALPAHVLTATYRCQHCRREMTAAPHELARTSWQKPAVMPRPGEIVDSLCPDCQQSPAPTSSITWKAGDKVTWLAESRGGYGFVQAAAGVVRAVTAQRIQVAVIENGKVAVKSVKPGKLKARDQPIDREPELETAEAPMQPHIALIYAWWNALPDNIRPPGDPPIEPNVKTAKVMRDAGFTPERVTAFVTETYPTYRQWAQKRSDRPGLMSLNNVLQHLKSWEDKTGKSAGREMTDEEMRQYWGGK